MSPFEKKALEMEEENNPVFNAVMTGICVTLDLIDDSMQGLRHLKSLVTAYAEERLEADNDP